jgi:hypothetical protein
MIQKNPSSPIVRVISNSPPDSDPSGRTLSPRPPQFVSLRKRHLNRKEPECRTAAFRNIAPSIRQLRLPLHLQPRHKRIPRSIGRMAEKNLCLLCSVSNHISMGLPLYCFFKFSTFLIQFLNTRISFYCLIGLQTDSLKSHRRQRRIPTYIRPPAESIPRELRELSHNPLRNASETSANLIFDE